MRGIGSVGVGYKFINTIRFVIFNPKVTKLHECSNYKNLKMYSTEQVPIGDACERNAQCSRLNTFATCTNNTCSCKEQFTPHNGICQSLIGKLMDVLRPNDYVKSPV